MADNTFVILQAHRRMGGSPDETLTWDPPDDPVVMAWGSVKAEIKKSAPKDSDIYLGRTKFKTIDEAISEAAKDILRHGHADLEILGAWDDSRTEYTIKKA